jgi:3-keto-5-aminohexanoate cleavage enzyme
VRHSGAVANKQQCPGIPYTPEEYAKEVGRARDAGAAMVHIHARTPDGAPTVAAEHYGAITQAILAETPDIIVNFSTGWVGLAMAERVAHITELKPEIGALNMGSMNYATGDTVDIGDPLVIRESMKMEIPWRLPREAP